jgi:hypothetical protein
MIVYNITVSLDPAIEKDWIAWMRTVHIPDVMNTKCFRDSKLCRVHAEEEGGVTYAITYTCFSQEHWDTYQKEHAPILQKEHSDKFAGQFAAFRTFLSVIEEF